MRLPPCCHDQLVVKENFHFEIVHEVLVFKHLRPSQHRDVKGSFAQRQQRVCTDQQLHTQDDAGMRSRKSLNDRREETGCNRFQAANPLPYDPIRDVVPISWAAANYLVVAAAESSKIGSLRELFARARSQPGKLNYNGGAGIIPYVFAGFLKSNDIDMVSVSYRETNLALQDLAEGRIQAVLAGITPALPFTQAGRIRLLSVINKTRAPLAPEIPTAIEAGYPDLTYEGWTGFYGPRDLPADVRDRIAADIRAVVADPVLADRLALAGQVARGSTPAEFSAALAEERARMTSIAKIIGATPAP
jgi:tripartite-type tricarboxylate transporter receptor subunit TctC